MNNQPLIIADRTFESRLFLGTGKFGDLSEMTDSIIASGSELVTMALKRIDSQSSEDDLLNALKPTRSHLLPNTSGARTAKEAVLVNTAIAVARNPVNMALAFKEGVIAGRRAFESGLGAIGNHAEASSPLTSFLFD